MGTTYTLMSPLARSVSSMSLEIRNPSTLGNQELSGKRGTLPQLSLSNKARDRRRGWPRPRDHKLWRKQIITLVEVRVM